MTNPALYPPTCFLRLLANHTATPTKLNTKRPATSAIGTMVPVLIPPPPVELLPPDPKVEFELKSDDPLALGLAGVVGLPDEVVEEGKGGGVPWAGGEGTDGVEGVPPEEILGGGEGEEGTEGGRFLGGGADGSEGGLFLGGGTDGFDGGV